MSYKSPSKSIKLKLPLPGSQDPSFCEPEMKYNNSLPISPIRNNNLSAFNSPVKHKLQLQSTMTTALTKSASPHKNLATMNTQTYPSAQRNLLSKSGTVAFDNNKSLSAEKTQQSPSPTNKTRRGSFLQELGMTTTEVKEKLYKIFQFYTSFGERSNVAYLKNHRFTKMMVDAEVRDDVLNQSSLDLLFVGELKHSGNLDFDKFLSLLTRVAKSKYEDKESEAEALETLLKENMFPLYERIFKDIGLQEDANNAQEPVEETTKMVINTVGSVLERIFNMYFPFEIQTGQDAQVLRQRLENALFIFLREFGICPNIINKGAAYAIWNDVLKADLDATDAYEEVNQTKRSVKSKANEKARDLPFSFERFKLFLVKVSNLAYREQVMENGTKCSQPERAMQLLEKMDVAFRVMNPEKKAAVPSSGTGTTSLLITKDQLEKITNHVKNQEASGIIKLKTVDGKGKSGLGVVVTSGTKYENYNIIDEDLIRLCEKHNHSLLKIFQYYCSFGEPMNTTKLHAFKFIKLLKEAGLLPATVPIGGSEQFFKILRGVPVSPDGTSLRLTIADVDIIIAHLTGPKIVRETNKEKMTYDPTIPTPFIGYLNYLFKNNPFDFAAQGRLEFEAFIKALEMVALKVHPEVSLGKAATRIIEKHLLKLEKEIDQIQKMVGSQPLKALVDVLQDVEMVQFLGVVHKSVGLYYRCYADSKGMMNREKFMQFCKDFGIFPNIVTKGKLCTFFNALAGVRSQAEQTDVFKNTSEIVSEKSFKKSKTLTKAVEQPEDDLIDQHMFVEALALCALEIPYLNPQPDEKQKIFNFLEKINQSQGTNIVKARVGSSRAVVGSSWDLMHEIKVKHPEFYQEPVEDENEIVL